MPDITEITIIGDWRIIVESKNAGWQQRVQASNTKDGTRILTGLPGNVMDVRGKGKTPWILRVQHNDGDTGWQDNWLRDGAIALSPGLGSIVRHIETEDITTPQSDRDFDDLVIRLEKIGMVAQPSRPHGIHPPTMMMNPDGVFETALGRHFMAVTVENIWTKAWPTGTSIGITDRSRAWLQAGGVRIIDSWTSEDQRILSQDVTADGRVIVGALQPWEKQVIYFKVDVASAAPRKHQVEVSAAEPMSHLNPDARAPMMVMRTRYDASEGVFTSECDRGTLVAAIKELTVDYNSLKRAVFKARQLFRPDPSSSAGGPGNPGPDRPGAHCGPAQIDALRKRLIAFLKGGDEDLCELWRELQCCCGNGSAGGGIDDDGSWGGKGLTGMEIIALPNLVDYRVEYRQSFDGQYGPIPYDDPWWKILLAIIAVILSLAAAGSAAADLANKSDDVVIGEVTRSVLDALVDAAVAELNGNRALTPAMFSYLDAESGEANETPLTALGAIIDTPGAVMTNDEIAAAITAFNTNPDDPDARSGVRVFKSGARTGLTFGVMDRVAPSSRDDYDDLFSDRTFQNQVFIRDDPDSSNGVSNSGDSGSLWLHRDTLRVVCLNHAGNRTNNTAIGSRIEDVMSRLNIRFA